MKVHFFICFLVFFSSCSRQIIKDNNNIVCDTILVNNSKSNQLLNKITIINLDSIKQEILKSKEKLSLSVLDTVKYIFSLEDVGTEGNEGIAYYLNDSVQKIEINIYTSMWKIYLLYVFDNAHIQVTEKIYNIVNEEFNNDIGLVKDFYYLINMEGVPIEKVDSDRIDIFQELKQAVPFSLK